MRLYFDTNLYDFIAEQNDVEAVRTMLHERGHDVEASLSVLAELYAVKGSKRVSRMGALTSIATFPEYPPGYLVAQEFLNEARRLQPSLVSSRPPNTFEVRALRRYRTLVRDAKHAPALLPDDFLEERPRLDAVRSEMADMATSAKEVLHGSKPDPSLTAVDPGLLESYWRRTAYLTWHAALVRRLLPSYAVWVLNYIGNSRVTGSLVSTVCQRAEAERVPRHVLGGVAAFMQSRRRPQPGDAFDIRHAQQLVDSDVVLTADQRLFRILEATRTLIPCRGRPLYVVRRGRPVDAITAALACVEDQRLRN